MPRRVREGGICVLTLLALCGCPPGPSPGPWGPGWALTAVEPAAPIGSGVYVTVQGRSDGITMFRADPAPVGTWVSIDPGLALPRLIATDPRAPATVYVVGAVSSTSSTNRLRKSDDAGATWATLFDTPSYIDRVAPDPGVTDRVWMTLQGGVGTPTMQRSDDGGQTWVVDDAGLPGGHQVHQLSFDAAATGVRYLSLSSGEVYRAETPGGVHTLITPPNYNVKADPGVPDRVYAWDSGGQLARSDDRGATWTTLPGGLPVVGQGTGWLLFDFAVDPSDPDRLYLGLCPAGVWISDDGGQTFQPGSPGALGGETVTRIHVDPTDPTQILAVSRSGPYLSEDRGVSWRLIDTSTATLEPFAGSAALPPGGTGKSTP